MKDAEFNDPVLVAVYDAECTWGAEDDFYVGLAGERPRSRVVDLGCGTGRLALGLAAAGHEVTGVDPSVASLEAAHAKPGAYAVEWIHGFASDLRSGAFDLALMTSHVGQFFIDEAAWDTALADLARAVVIGGRLAFESRDPDARGWEMWNPIDSARVVRLPFGEVHIETDVLRVEGPVVQFVHRYVLPDGARRTSETTLAFRSKEAICAALVRAGFIVEAVWGGWRREPVGAGDGELIFVARRG